MSEQPPLIVHVIHRLQVGGLENGLVNLINRLPVDRYRHAIVAMTEITSFRERIQRSGVDCYAMHKKPGKDFGVYIKLWRLFRKLKPAVVHTRNVNTLEAQWPAWLAGVRRRVHGEHGRNMEDLDGENKKYLLMRRLFRWWVHRYVALSMDMKQWLLSRVRVNPKRLVHIYNGVDTERFIPGRDAARELIPVPLRDGFIIGTVGRLQAEKNQAGLVRVFIRLAKQKPATPLRLVIFGDGEVRAELENLLADANVTEAAWLAGNRDDVAQLLPALDLFVLPSLGEGISNTILEAMACGVPILATRVGGNAELVIEGKTGSLVAAADDDVLIAAVTHYLDNPSLLREHGLAGRRRVESTFSLQAMVDAYQRLYDDLLAR